MRTNNRGKIKVQSTAKKTNAWSKDVEVPLVRTGPSRIHGTGLFADTSFMPGKMIGMSHMNDQMVGDIGNYNHSDMPNAFSIKQGNSRYIAPLRQIQKGEEITLDYRQQPELEQPEAFGHGGGWLDTYQIGGPLGKPGYVPAGTYPSFKNQDGSHSNEVSMGFRMDDKSMNLPSFWDGQRHTPDQTLNRYKKTGEHLGAYATEADAERGARLREFMNQEVLPYTKNGGTPDWLDTYQIGGTSQDSLRHQAGKTMDFERIKGNQYGTGLTNYGFNNSKQVIGTETPTKEQAIDYYMNTIAPELNNYSSAMEKGEAGDFLYNTGRDPRVYQIDQYLKSKGKSGIPNRGSYNVDTKTSKWTPELQKSLNEQWNEHSPEINKLSENERRVLLNKGRDFYYQNIERQPGGINENLKAYNATWKPRIWEAVNTYKQGGQPPVIDRLGRIHAGNSGYIPQAQNGWNYTGAENAADSSAYRTYAMRPFTRPESAEDRWFEIDKAIRDKSIDLLSPNIKKQLLLEYNALSEGRTRKLKQEQDGGWLDEYQDGGFWNTVNEYNPVVYLAKKYPAFGKAIVDTGDAVTSLFKSPAPIEKLKKDNTPTAESTEVSRKPIVDPYLVSTPQDFKKNALYREAGKMYDKERGILSSKNHKQLERHSPYYAQGLQDIDRETELQNSKLQKDTDNYFINHAGSTPDSVYASKQLWNKYGKPYIEVAPIETKRAYYTGSENKMNLDPEGQIHTEIPTEQFIAEMTHAQQNQEFLNTGVKSWKDTPEFNTQKEYDEYMYHTPGTIEHDAHTIRQPKLIQQYDSLLKAYPKLTDTQKLLEKQDGGWLDQYQEAGEYKWDPNTMQSPPQKQLPVAETYIRPTQEARAVGKRKRLEAISEAARESGTRGVPIEKSYPELVAFPAFKSSSKLANFVVDAVTGTARSKTIGKGVFTPRTLSKKSIDDVDWTQWERQYKGKNIAETGAFNKGVHEIKGHPDYVVKVEAPKLMGEYVNDYANLDQVSLHKNLTSPNVAKIIKQIPHPNKPGQQLLVMPRISGKAIDEIPISQLKRIPEDSFKQLYKDLRVLRNNKLAVDWVGKNILYDAKTKKFGIIDLSPADNVDPFWEDVILKGVNPKAPVDQSAKAIRSALESHLKKYSLKPNAAWDYPLATNKRLLKMHKLRKEAFNNKMGSVRQVLENEPVHELGGAKAAEMLRDGTAHGKPLTHKQQKYFGYLANKQTGGWLDDYNL